MSALNLIRPDLVSSDTYFVDDERLEYKLDFNELPWSPLASKEHSELNRYPDNLPREILQRQLADYYDVQETELVLTRGSDEGIDLLMRLFLQAKKDSIMQFPPTFSMYSFFARLQGVEVISCPLSENEENFIINTELIEASWGVDCKFIMICRPNNPTGHLMDLQQIAELCQQFHERSMIIVDEAYIEFSEALSATSLISQFDNLIVLRTLSKAYGLAGLRLGAVISQEATILALKKIMAPFMFASTVLDLGLLALKRSQWFLERWNDIKLLRSQLARDLQASDWIEKIYPSEANFILLKSIHAAALYEWFNQHNIAVRSFRGQEILSQHLRITVGDERQNARLLEVLGRFSPILDVPRLVRGIHGSRV